MVVQIAQLIIPSRVFKDIRACIDGSEYLSMNLTRNDSLQPTSLINDDLYFNQSMILTIASEYSF